MSFRLTPFLLIGLLSSAVAQPVEDYEFSQIEPVLLNEVVVQSCKEGMEPCADSVAKGLSCIPKDLTPEQKTRACSLYRKAVGDFVFECPIVLNGEVFQLGKTRNPKDCSSLQQVWDELSKDPFFTGKTAEWKLSFIRSTLLAPRGGLGRSNPGIPEQIQFNRNGGLKPRSARSQSILERAKRNLDDYRNGWSGCGPRIVAGIDQLPVLDQNQQGTCYAHTASTMTDYVRAVRGDRLHSFSSPLMLAIDRYSSQNDIERLQNNLADKTDPFSGGTVCSAVRKNFEQGFCDSSKIELQIRRIKPGSREDPIAEYLTDLGKLFKNKKWDQLRREFFHLKSPDCPSHSPLDFGRALGLTESEAAWAQVKNSPDLLKFYSNFFSIICDRKPFPFRVECKHTEFFDDAPTTQNIDSYLAKGYPIGISYCDQVLSDKYAHTGRNFSDPEMCGRHASVLVGTALNKKGECSYVIRNSWGTNCSYYDSSYDCMDGNVYIPKEKLADQILGIHEIVLKQH